MNVVPAPGPPTQPEETARRAEAKAAQLGLRVPSILFEGDEASPEPIKGLGLKYALSPSGPGAHASTDESTLPESYHTGRLWLAPRDPHSLYAHWDLKPDQQAGPAEAAAPGALVLRIHSERSQVAEISRPSESRHAFVEVPFAGACYSAELGFYNRPGDWRSLAISNSAWTPREMVSGEKTARFATFPFDRPPAPPPEQLTPAATAANPGLSHAASSPAAQSVHQFPPTFPPSPEAMQSLRLPQALPPASVTLREGEPASELIEPRAPGVLASSPAFTSGLADWTAAQEDALANLIGWTVPWRNRPGSGEFVESASSNQAPFGLRMELSQPGSVPVQAPPGISSFAGGDLSRPKEFWLAVNAELVIYGSTEPDSRVTIGGRLIQLRSDGTFSYRFSLPDGRFELPIAAASAQGDLREVNLEFMRATSCRGEVGAHPQDPALADPGQEKPV